MLNSIGVRYELFFALTFFGSLECDEIVVVWGPV